MALVTAAEMRPQTIEDHVGASMRNRKKAHVQVQSKR